VCPTLQSRSPRLNLMPAHVTHMAPGGSWCRVGTVFDDIIDTTASMVHDAISFTPQFQLR
jgi:hypothetical protein